MGRIRIEEESVLYATLQGFVIKGDTMGWMVGVRIPPGSILRHPKRPNVTVNAPVKYCYEKGQVLFVGRGRQRV